MQKNRKNKKIFIVLLVVLILLVVIAVGLGRKETTDSEGESKEAETIVFPYSLEDGKLMINSLFQASVQNPDCNDEIEEDIASLEIINQSEEYCKEAEISLKMQDGTEVKFKLFDIPAGKTLWAFNIDNQSITQENKCVEIESTAVFGDASEMPEEVEYVVNDSTITIHNLTEQDISNLSVYYHCLFEEAYYGGISYCQTIEVLPANAEVSIEADECYMGIAEVVKIVKE